MKKILLLLADGFEMYEASVFIDIIGWNKIHGNGLTELFSCGMRKHVKTSFNQELIVDYLLTQINIHEFEALAVPGGFEEYGFYNDAFDPSFSRIIRSFHEQKKAIVSICTGSLALVKSGILKNRNATTYQHSYKRADQLVKMGAKFVNQPIVCDKNIITSWDPSTAVEVGFRLLERLTSVENSDCIRTLMGFKKTTP